MGLLYFTNYHIHDYKTSRLTPRLCPVCSKRPKGVFIGQGVVHIDQEHQQNKPNKGLSEKTQSSKRGHAREETVLKVKHVQRNMPTLYTS
jgi:hypothetical protein